jgi:hypothetical protein
MMFLAYIANVNFYFYFSTIAYGESFVVNLCYIGARILIVHV